MGVTAGTSARRGGHGECGGETGRGRGTEPEERRRDRVRRPCWPPDRSGWAGRATGDGSIPIKSPTEAAAAGGAPGVRLSVTTGQIVAQHCRRVCSGVDGGVGRD